MISGRNRLDLYILAGLGLLVAAIYGQTIGQDFIRLDDPLFISNNKHVLQGLTWDNLRWAFTTKETDYWHPLTWLSLMLDVSLFGLHAGASKYVSALFHFGAVCFLFIFLRNATEKAWPSALAAALLAVHPMHVESVAWVTERKDVLFLFFGMVSTAAYVRYAKDRGALWYGFSLLALGLGLMSKVTLVTLPALFLLLDYWPLCRIDWKGWKIVAAGPSDRLGNILLEKVPFFVLSLAVAVAVRAGAQSREWNGYSDTAGFTWIFEFAYSYVLYLKQAFLPVNIAAFFPRYDVSTGLGVASLASLLVLTAAALYFGKKYRYLATGWLWFAGALVPTVAVFFLAGALGTIYSRFSYLPYIGLYMAFAFGAWELCERHDARKAFLSVSAVLVILLAGMAFMQARTWQDSETTFQHALDVTGDNWLAHKIIGTLARRNGDMVKARTHLEKSYALNKYAPETVCELSEVYLAEGEEDKILPMYDALFERYPGLPGALNNYGFFLLRLGHPQEAEKAFLAAVDAFDNAADTHNNLAILYVNQGDYPRALEQSLTAIEQDPDIPEYQYMAGVVYGRMRDLDNARKHLEAALALDPGFDPAKRALQAIRGY